MGLVLVAIAFSLVSAPMASAQDCAGADVRADSGGDLGAASRATLCLVNVERERAGLVALEAQGQLKRAARSHSKDMVANRYFAHDSPSGSTVLSRIKRAGYLRGARMFVLRENIGWGFGRRASPREVVAHWMTSTEHRANILNPVLRDGGVGVAVGSPVGGPGATYTLDFGKRRR